VTAALTPELVEAAAEVQVTLASVIRHARLPRMHRKVMTDAGVFIDRSSYTALAHVDILGEVSLSDLAADMLLDISTVSRQVRRLEDAGLVERHPHPDDKRVSMVGPTEAGRRVANRLNHAWQSAFAEALTDWSAEDLALLAGWLLRFDDSLRRVAEQ
jgi:DNA-binding MarR family transcriptional regulator